MVLLVIEVSPLQSLSCFVFGTSKLSASKVLRDGYQSKDHECLKLLHHCLCACVCLCVYAITWVTTAGNETYY